MEKHLLKNTAVILLCIVLTVDSNRKKRNDNQCGVPLGSLATGKIVGGYDIGYYKYPWYVALKKDGEVYCGGTLIHSRFIVTAAHCFQPFFKIVDAGKATFEKLFKPTFGIYNVCTTEPTQKEFQVAKVYVHERYKKMDPYFDIALLKLKRPAKGFHPCCLPKKKLYSRSRPKEALVSGLGDLKYNTLKLTCTMQEARVLIYDDDACKKMLNSNGEDGSLMQHAFCAGYMQGGIDACQGDSGGPLVIQNANGRLELLGITSFGFECAKPGTLGLYTDASHYLDWINKKMKFKQNSTQSTTNTPAPVTPNPNDSDTSDESTEGDQSQSDESDADSDTTTIKSMPKSTPGYPGNSTSSVDWSSYPATPWEDLIPPDYPSVQPRPPVKKPPSHHHHHKWNSITIIINKKNKNKHQKMKTRISKQKKIHKYKKERGKEEHILR